MLLIEHGLSFLSKFIFTANDEGQLVGFLIYSPQKDEWEAGSRGRERKLQIRRLVFAGGVVWFLVVVFCFFLMCFVFPSCPAILIPSPSDSGRKQ